MLSVADGERMLQLRAVGSHVGLLVEVAEQECGASALHDLRKEFHSLANIRATAFRLEVEHLANDVEDVLTSFLGRNVFFYAVREEDDANLIVVLNGRERQCGSNLGNHIALHLLRGSEVERTADVDQKHHRQLALFFENLHIGAVEAGGYIPVDVAHVVAELILAHLREGHTTSPEGRVILTCKDVRAQAARLDLNLPDFLD